jgi:hypothetical protein
VWNNICEFLESKDGEIRQKSKANGKAWLGLSRHVIGCRTKDDDEIPDSHGVEYEEVCRL